VLGSHDAAWRPGVPDRVGAALALASLEAATALTVRGAAAGLVTGPVAKARLAEVGFAHPGQTEFVAAACGVPADDAVMMLAGPSLRTVPITVHVALAAVPGLISAALIERNGAIVVAALAREFAALNPHAGEEGRMGDEDQRIVAPAVAALQARGIDASGPHSADALFAPHLRGTYDTVLCMYHDQALIPLKTLDFDSGINLTLGLPIVRTSPDHGTAFSLAGTRRASSGAMIAAIRLAGEIAARRAMK
jgi:4-hydroxythreonine-4-phosphate dehydrogenase